MNHYLRGEGLLECFICWTKIERFVTWLDLSASSSRFSDATFYLEAINSMFRAAANVAGIAYALALPGFWALSSSSRWMILPSGTEVVTSDFLNRGKVDLL